MLAQSDASVIFYALYIASKVGATGLTVTVDVWEVLRDGTSTEIVTGGSATEIGDGLYRYLLVAGSVDEAAEYIAVFKTADTSVDRRDIAALWVIDRNVRASAVIQIYAAGAVEFTYTLTSTEGGNPIANAVIWISTDQPGANVVWRGDTDNSGIARGIDNSKPWLTTGTYYVFAQKSGYSFDNPDTEVVA